jgi:hypothetical protein
VGGGVLVLGDKAHTRELPAPLEDLRHDPVLDRRRFDVDREVADLKAGLLDGGKTDGYITWIKQSN